MILLAPTTRLSTYGEDTYNHGIYNLHSGLLTGAIKAIVTISAAVSSATEIRTAVDSSSSAKEAVSSSSDIMTAVGVSSRAIPAVSSTLQISYPNKGTI